MRTIIYCRISSIGQTEGVSLDAQLDQCKQLCVSNRIENTTHVQEVSSAYSSTPPILDTISKYRNTRVVFYAVDRFSRNVQNGINMAEAMLKNKCVLVFAREQLVVNSVDSLLWSTFVAAMRQAETESKAISQRVKGAITYLKRHGYHASGHIPYGYSVVPDADKPNRKRLVENPDEQKVLTFIRLCITRGSLVSEINDALKVINPRADSIVIEHRDEFEPLKRLAEGMQMTDIAYFLEKSTYRGKPWTAARVSSAWKQATRQQTAAVDAVDDMFQFMNIENKYDGESDREMESDDTCEEVKGDCEMEFEDEVKGRPAHPGRRGATQRKERNQLRRQAPLTKRPAPRKLQRKK